MRYWVLRGKQARKLMWGQDRDPLPQEGLPSRGQATYGTGKREVVWPVSMDGPLGQLPPNGCVTLAKPFEPSVHWFPHL